MWKVWKEIIPFRTSYFTNMTKYALVDWYNFTWNCYLLPLLQGCEESGLFFIVFWKVILKQEDFFPVTRCLSFDQLSSILPAPTPPPHLPPCGYMMQCYFGKCPLLLSWYNFKNSCKYKNATTTITNSHVNTAFESESVHGFTLNSISCTVVHKQPNPPLPQNGCS